MPSSNPRYRIFLFFVVAAVLIRVFFWVYTNRIWEDTLITVRHAENAAQGNGLTHHVGHGEVVHGFTSAISALIPLFAESVYPGSGIPFQKFVSLVAAAITVWLGYRIAIHPSVDLTAASTTFALGFLSLDHTHILFGMAGMETQCVVAITLLNVWLAIDERWNALGIACGLAVYARPDGVIVVTGMVAYTLWRKGWVTSLKVGVISVLVFLPWLAFTTWYYGSPIPHTILAKRLGSTSVANVDRTFVEEVRHQAMILASRANYLRIWFSPVFAGCGGAVNTIRGARPIQLVYGAFVFVGLIGLLWNKNTGRALALGALSIWLYFWLILPLGAPWYVPPLTGLLVFLFGSGVDRVRGCFRDQQLVNRLCMVMPLLLLCCYAFNLTRTFPAERLIQREIEDKVRMQVGKWLDVNAAPNDWIGVECLGYVGYYANRPMLDFPGLASPRSLRRLRQQPGDMMNLFAAEQPEWLVLRPHEFNDFVKRFPETAKNYVLAHRVVSDPKAIEQLDAWLFLSDRKISLDKEFLILKRTAILIPTVSPVGKSDATE